MQCCDIGSHSLIFIVIAVGELYSGHNIKLVRKNYQTKPEARKKHR